LSVNRYSIVFTRRARKDLDKLDRQVIARIVPVIDALADDPRPPVCVRVKSEADLWRIRVGDWRIGYEINDAASEVTIIRIAHRSEFYD
jgi:mRNA interferase RelE/StbE